MTEPSKLCLYFGCWGIPGHRLVVRGDRPCPLSVSESWDLQSAIDGHFAPRKANGGAIVRGVGVHFRSIPNPVPECPQGQFLRSRHGRWTLIQWWDRCQGDAQPGSNSTILLEGERTTKELLAALHEHFPEVLANLNRHGIELVEVFLGES